MGSDSADGSSLSPVRTLSAAAALAENGDMIEIFDSAEMPEYFSNPYKALTITGGILDFTALTSFAAQSDLTFKNINLITNANQKLYANGYPLTMDIGVTMSNRIYLYGGRAGGKAASTDLTIKSGSYEYIFGGNGKGDITCDTSVRFEGGYIQESIYGGNESGFLTGNTQIIMSGGRTEAIFGGSLSSSMRGNTFISITGGEVTRRIFGGCYNDFGPNIITGSWMSKHFVDGTTNISVGSTANIATSTALEDLDKGIYGGSRCGSSKNSISEVNTIITLDNCYGKFAGALSPVTSVNPARQHCDYLIKSAAGGIIYATETAGRVKVVPNDGYSASVNGGTPFTGGGISILTGESTVTYSINI